MAGCYAGRLQVVMEYASHGNLRNFLRCHRPAAVTASTSSTVTASSSLNRVTHDAVLTPCQLMTFSLQVAAGMQHLASLKVQLQQHY